MNSSEVKKIIWAINLIVICGLGLVSFFVYKQLSKPAVVLKPFVYVEPMVTDKLNTISHGVSRTEVETVFGWKPPQPKVDPIPTKKTEPVAEVKPVPPVSNVNNMFSLETILGRLAFVIIKKDKQMKSFIAGDEIFDAGGELLGVVKEVREDSILILIKDKIETLFMEGLEKEGIKGTSDPKSSPQTNLVPNVAPSTKTQPNNEPKIEPKKVEATITYKKPLVEDNSVSSPLPNEVADSKIHNRQKSSFEGIEFEFYDTTDADGTLHRKIPEEMAVKLQQKEVIKKFTDTSNYELVFQANGVLIKSIKNAEIKKFFAAFGISDNDVLLSVNGQSLGNKTEDDLISLYQQIIDTAKYATIELLKDGVRQKYRVSTDRIKQAGVKK